jgi:hypothetical protein
MNIFTELAELDRQQMLQREQSVINNLRRNHPALSGSPDPVVDDPKIVSISELRLISSNKRLQEALNAANGHIAILQNELDKLKGI